MIVSSATANGYRRRHQSGIERRQPDHEVDEHHLVGVLRLGAGQRDAADGQREQRASSRRRSSRARSRFAPGSCEQAAREHLPARGAHAPPAYARRSPATPYRSRSRNRRPAVFAQRRRSRCLPHDRSEWPHEASWRAHGGQRRLVPLRARHCDRIPRTERRRQDHHDADDRRALHARRRQLDRARARLPRPGEPGPPDRRPARRQRPASRPPRPRGARGQRADDGRRPQARRRAADARRAGQVRGPQARAPVLARHAPAARARARAARRPRGADPRRARQRPRSRGHPLDARACCATSPTAAGPCSCPRTCSTRSRRSPTSS